MLYIAFLVLIEAVLFAANYKPGTFLMGWDNIMPELNIPLNFTRSLFSVWQDYRGLGTVDGMSQAANLVHTFYIFLLSSFLPQNIERFAMITLLHFAGGIAFFYLAGSLVKDKRIALGASLFYMFNIGVIQMFYAPLEVFIFHFAALPMLALFIKKSFEKANLKNLSLLFTASFLTSPQGFVPTIFGVFLILFAAFAVVEFLKNRDLKKILIVTLIILASNAFWLAPYVVNAPKSAKVIPNTRINEFSSEEVYLRNRSDGDLQNVLLMKGFMLDSLEYDSAQNKNILFMQKWRSYFETPFYKLAAIFFVIIALIGFLNTIIKKGRENIVYVIAISLSFIFLANNTPGIAQINDILRHFLPVVGEALRFPFTKFIILFAFCLSVFVALGLEYLLNFGKKVYITILTAVFLGIAILSYPAFSGYFFSPLLKVTPPADYAKMFSDINSRPYGRIALLPAYTFWNWQYRNWGQFGSGFDWYAINKPILERAFDPWSFYNEQFYNEFSYAINKNNTELFNKVLDKYDISYLLLDKSLLNSVTRGQINFQSLEDFLNSDNRIAMKSRYGSLLLYGSSDNLGPVYTLTQALPKTDTGFAFGNEDSAFAAIGNYLKNPQNPNYTFLLPSLFTNKLQNNLTFSAENETDSIIFTPKEFFKNVQNNKTPNLVLPSLFESEFLIPVEIKAGSGKITFNPIYPKVTINGKTYQPQAKSFTLDIGNLNPSSIYFPDTKSEVLLRDSSAKAYILNHYLNTIQIKSLNFTRNFALDTQGVEPATFLLPIPSEQIKTITITVDKFDTTITIPDAISSREYKITESPDPLKLFTGDILTDEQISGTNVNLAARGNSAVDLNFYRDNLPHQGSYIMFIDSNYKSGLPVSFYVENSFSSRPESETKLSKTHNTNVVIIPQTENAFSGYGFHFTVKSVGREYAESSIKKISLYPFPLETIQKIRIQLDSPAPNQTQKAAASAAKINSSLYLAHIPVASNQGYVALSESFDTGWHAYRVNNNGFLAKYFPFFAGSELREHFELNGWANAWKMSDTGGNYVAMVYLPQYLEHAGFLLLGEPVFFFVFRFFRSHFFPSNKS